MTHAIAHHIAGWHPLAEVDDTDPLSVYLSVTPTYLPLLQPKNAYFHFGRRSISYRVLGLSPEGDWVEDGSGKGVVSWRYGEDSKCFGKAPFALSPLTRLKRYYPELATIIWNGSHLTQMTDRYLSDWKNMIGSLERDSLLDSTWLVRSGYAGTSAALGRLETPAALMELRSALSSSTAYVRELAVGGLWNTTPGQGIEHWLIPLSTDSEASVRTAVATALGNIGTEQSLEVLVRLLEDEPNIQQAAVEALVVLGLPQAREPIVQTARVTPNVTGSAPVGRMTALLALQTFWRDSDVGLLLESLYDAAAAVRAAAAYVLGEQSIRIAIPSLRTALHDSAPEVRSNAAWALAKLNDESSIPEITLLMEEGVRGFEDPIAKQSESEPIVAQMALERLAEQGSLQAVQLIRALGLDQ